MSLTTFTDLFHKIQEIAVDISNKDLDRGDSIQIDLINEIYGKMNTLVEFDIMTSEQFEDLADFLISTNRTLESEIWKKSDFKMLENLIKFSDYLVESLDKFSENLVRFDIVGSLKK